MTALWDTTLVSRIQPDSDALGYVVDQVALGDPVRIAAPAVLEIAYGYERALGGDSRFMALLAWFTRLLASDAFSIVELDGRAALVAGRLRAAQPHPPANKRDRRSKPMRQASWLLDIQIAATAFAAGLDVATENRGDFEVLADALNGLFPGAPPLDVVDGPLAVG